MRFKGPHSATPGLHLEKSEIKILYAREALVRAIVGTLGEEAGQAFIAATIAGYQRELADEAIKAGAGATRTDKPSDPTGPHAKGGGK